MIRYYVRISATCQLTQTYVCYSKYDYTKWRGKDNQVDCYDILLVMHKTMKLLIRNCLFCNQVWIIKRDHYQTERKSTEKKLPQAVYVKARGLAVFTIFSAASSYTSALKSKVTKYIVVHVITAYCNFAFSEMCFCWISKYSLLRNIMYRKRKNTKN